MQKKERQSGVELLRIISMFLVLIIHANAFGVKWDALDLDNSLASGITTIALQSVSCVCVNVFVLISGWFGIRFSWRGLTRFLFQCFFFLFGIYIVMLFGGKTTLSIEGLAGCFMYNPQIQISAESGTKRSIFRQKNKTKRSKKRLHTTLIKPEQKVNEDLCSGFIVS